MAIAVISDIHGNLEALTKAIDYIKEQGIKDIYCLGDVVGYGPNPNECVEIIRQQCKVVLMGNHDYAAIGLARIEYFNDFAKMATYWTMNQLTTENKEFLRNLPFMYQTDRFIMVHSSPSNPEHWYYILSLNDALIEMQSFKQDLCFVGHSHVPVVFNQKATYKRDISIEPNQKYIVNVGSIGQPRDGDARLSFVIFDPDAGKIQFVRLDYEVNKTYEKIIKSGLPSFLAERILKGY
ncbi:metallophosphoesterase [Caldithrix abyssi DSM 13497]|uniref:Metallophosphoesterase n=1 Tax=Caldithrix abyssi DSM 13497 TaxID=880073 RepID=H1XNS4_CALAY|nr:metallophosphoesterase family protein [Caldithrix abyssi]APF19759.1 putative phosphodiesterase [Caldithrix abyssi DSM 13497]EHO39864.1 metallophosphoesterase [Caldithrix abyssi DSM 13497]